MPGPTKITFGEMRGMGVRGVLIYCADYRCSHSIAVNADQSPAMRPNNPVYDPFASLLLG